MSASIAILPSYQFFKATGQPAANCKLHTYLANTLTDVTTWSDKDQITENSNPITLDSDGRCTLWIEPGIYIDLVLKDELDVSVIDTFEDITGATSTVLQESEWVVTGLAATYVSATSFTLPGNQTSTFKVGRWVRAVEGASYKYGVIISSVFTSSTAVTIATDSSTLTPSLTTVDIGQLSPNPTSGLYGSGNKVMLTGYTGSDIVLQPGQYSTYSISGVTSLPLRISTGNDQRYEITINNTWAAGANGAACTLNPNNTTFANAFYFMATHNRAGAGAYSNVPNNNTIQLDDGGKIWEIIAKISTKTISKMAKSEYMGSNAAQALSGDTFTAWQDTTTVWSSLGTLNFSLATTGLVTVKRIY